MKSQNSTVPENQRSYTNIILELERVLRVLDKNGMDIPAIRIAEAVDAVRSMKKKRETEE